MLPIIDIKINQVLVGVRNRKSTRITSLQIQLLLAWPDKIITNLYIYIYTYIIYIHNIYT